MKLVGWPGSKTHLIKPLVNFIDSVPHVGFIEPFCGSGIVTLNKQPAKWEIINDKHRALMNFFWCVKHKSIVLSQMLGLTISSEAMYNNLNHPGKLRPRRIGDVRAAFRFLYCNRQAFGMRLGDKWTLPMHAPNYRASELIKLVTKAHLRMENVSVMCRDYKKSVPKAADKSTTLVYLDPPYMDSTTKGYAGVVDYEEFIQWAVYLEAKVIISHEKNKKFHGLMTGWYVTKLGQRTNHIAGTGKSKRGKQEEWLYTNFKPPVVRRSLL